MALGSTVVALTRAVITHVGIALAVVYHRDTRTASLDSSDAGPVPGSHDQNAHTMQGDIAVARSSGRTTGPT